MEGSIHLNSSFIKASMDPLSESAIRSESKKSKDKEKKHKKHHRKHKHSDDDRPHRKKSDKDREKEQHTRKKHKESHNNNEISSIPSSLSANANSVEILQNLVKEQPNYNTTGRLYQQINIMKNNNNNSNITINNNNSNSSSMYKEPVDACVPTDDWRLYKYESSSTADTATTKTSPEIYYISHQSCYRIGKSIQNNDLILDISSAEDYHAVIQYKKKQINIEGQLLNTVKPYLIDLNSVHGTFINNKPILPLRPTELLESDIIQFALLSDNRGSNNAVNTQFILLKGAKI